MLSVAISDTTCLSSRSSAISRSWCTVSARSVVVVVAQPPIELGEDLRGVRPRGPDEEDPVEPLLVGRVARGESRGDLGVAGVHAGLLARASSPLVPRAEARSPMRG